MPHEYCVQPIVLQRFQRFLKLTVILRHEFEEPLDTAIMFRRKIWLQKQKLNCLLEKMKKTIHHDPPNKAQVMLLKLELIPQGQL